MRRHSVPRLLRTIVVFLASLQAARAGALSSAEAQGMGKPLLERATTTTALRIAIRTREGELYADARAGNEGATPGARAVLSHAGTQRRQQASPSGQAQPWHAGTPARRLATAATWPETSQLRSHPQAGAWPTTPGTGRSTLARASSDRGAVTAPVAGVLNITHAVPSGREADHPHLQVTFDRHRARAPCAGSRLI